MQSRQHTLSSCTAYSKQAMQLRSVWLAWLPTLRCGQTAGNTVYGSHCQINFTGWIHWHGMDACMYTLYCHAPAHKHPLQPLQEAVRDASLHGMSMSMGLSGKCKSVACLHEDLSRLQAYDLIGLWESSMTQHSLQSTLKDVNHSSTQVIDSDARPHKVCACQAGRAFTCLVGCAYASRDASECLPWVNVRN